MADPSGPAAVLIIRHGEKVGDPAGDGDGGPDLSVRGSARAAALPALFAPAAPDLACAVAAKGGTGFTGEYGATGVTGAPPRFPTPDFLFATAASKHSNRPVETVTPVSAALHLAVDDKHADADYGKVAADLLTHPKYAGKTVLVCWHHGTIPALAAALGVAAPPHWPGTVFDRVWQVTAPGAAAALADAPQMLLYGDSAQ